MVPLALVTAAFVLAAWFPLSTWWHQQAQLSAATTQLNAIRHQEQVLKLQAESISTKSSAILLARQQYQLVNPGQSLIQVLPGVEPGRVSQTIGDPGLQPLVSPSSVSTLVTAQPTTSTRHSKSGGFFSRLVRTLEFWR